MIVVAITVVLATAIGITSEHRLPAAPQAAAWSLQLMLYGLVPFVTFVSFAHLHLTLGAGAGLVLAWIGLGLAGTATWALGRHWLHLPRPSLGALICCVMVVNTGYLGLPMSVALLGTGQLSHAVAYDQVVSGPLVFTVGFAVGAAFGTRTADGRGRLRAFLTRNPPLVAVVAGLIVPASLAPHVLVAASHIVVDVMLVVGFFAVGVNLSAERRADHARLLERPDRRVGLGLALRFTITPALMGLASLVGVGIPPAYLLQTVMPSGINSLIVGYAFGLDQRLIATMIVWATLVVLAGGLIAYVV